MDLRMDGYLFLVFHPWIWVDGWVWNFHNASIYGINPWMDGWMDDSTFSYIGLPAQFWVFDQDCESVAELGEWVRGSLDYFASVITESIQKGGVSCNRYCPQTMTPAHVRFFSFFGVENQHYCDTHFNLSILPCVCKRQSLKGVGGLRGLKGGSSLGLPTDS